MLFDFFVLQFFRSRVKQMKKILFSDTNNIFNSPDIDSCSSENILSEKNSLSSIYPSHILMSFLILIASLLCFKDISLNNSNEYHISITQLPFLLKILSYPIFLHKYFRKSHFDLLYIVHPLISVMSFQIILPLIVWSQYLIFVQSLNRKIQNFPDELFSRNKNKINFKSIGKFF